MRMPKPRLLRGNLGQKAALPESPPPAEFKAPKKTNERAGAGVTEVFPWQRFAAAWSGTAGAAILTVYLLGLAPFGLSEALDTAVETVSRDEPAAEETADFVTPAATDPEIIIPAIGLKAPIKFPRSPTLASLNTALTEGAVHYPESPLPGEDGNVFIFGHSTGLKVVRNKNFEIFNQVKDLKPGAVIRLRYGSRDYLYRVSSLTQKPADEIRVDFKTPGKKLTITTCNVWGGHEARYVVEAEFLRSYPVRIRELAGGSSPDTSL